MRSSKSAKMGNRIAKSASDSVTVNHANPPYRPIKDPATGQPLHVCGYKDLMVDKSCAAGELWWESKLEPDLNMRPEIESCKTRNMSNSFTCDTNGGFPNVEGCQYHTCSTVRPSEDCKQYLLKSVIGTPNPDSYASVSLAVENTRYDGRRYTCTYRASEIGSSCEIATQFTQDAKDALDLMPFDDFYENSVMNALCSQRAPPGSCPDRPDGKPWPVDFNGAPVCSQMIACPLCKAWAVSTVPGAATQSDNIMQQWCDAHPKDPSCNCVRRAEDLLYVQLQTGLPNTPAGCWWKGCMDKKMQFDMVQSEDRSFSECPKVNCQNIINITGGEVDIGTINMSVACEYTGDETSPACATDCGEHGACVPGGSDGKGVCKCEAGWHGVGCEIPDTPDEDPDDEKCMLDCGAHGDCRLDQRGSPTCVCDEGWEGVSCDKEKAVPPPDDGDKPKPDYKKIAVVAGASVAALIGVALIASAFRKSKK